jgi:hypothetical protein
VLGPFDEDTLRHSGTPSFEWQTRTARESNWQKVQACAKKATDAVRQHAETSSEGVGVNWIKARLEGVRAETKTAGIEEAVLRGALRFELGPRNSRLHFYVKDYIPHD